MNAYEVLEIKAIQDQIHPFIMTEMGHFHLESLTFFTSSLALHRQLQRQRAALDLTTRFGHPSFSGIHDIELALQHSLKQGTLNIEQLVGVSRFSHGIAQLIQYGKSHQKDLLALEDLFDSLSTDLSIAKEIDRCLSSDFHVYDKASTTLFDIRKRLKSLDEKITNSTSYFLNKYASLLVDNFATLRNNRLVLPIKTSEKNNFKGIVHDQSASGQTTFIEPQELVDLNNEKQSLLVEEQMEIVRICRHLSQLVTPVASNYLASMETAGILDSLFAKGRWAALNDGCVPELTTSGFYLKQARHPLLDPDKVVANTFQLNHPQHMILITGPNTGGKTVALKTIGVSLYLAQCGYPILCDAASFTMHDAIYVDIGDHQSILESLSTFSSHLQNLKIVLEKASSTSLVLLDELGSGTDPLEGESLAQAILENLYTRKTPTIATSHFNKLKQFVADKPEIISASVQFDLSTLSPTFKYLDTMSGQSYGLDIAMKLDLDETVIQRARQIKEQAQSETLQLIEHLEKQVSQQQVLNDKLVAQEQQLAQSRQKYEKQLASFETEKASMLKAFENNQEARLQKILTQARKHLNQIRELEQEPEVLSMIEDIKQLQSRPEAKETIAKDLKVGDHVKIMGTQQFGTVLELDKKEAMVDVRGLRMSVPLNQLTHHTVKPSSTPKKRVQSRVSSSFSATSSSSLELNLIGQRYEQAQMELLKFIDQAVVSKRNMIRVIHGHGSGVLREMTHSVLKSHPAILSYRLGQENEGGVGATVVTLK